MSEIGHNQPPDMAATAGETAQDLSGWMAENPIISTEEKAREAKVFIDRGNNAVKDLEDERTGKVRPLNEQVKTINDHYRGPRELLERVVDELKGRMDRFLLDEEAKRFAAAEALRVAAERAEQIARDAERLERERIDSANHGELGVDVVAAVGEADRAFAAYEKAERQAQVAERDAKVRIGGGFTRALSLRERETISVGDWIRAIQSIGLTDDIKEAILKSARAYKRLKGKWPDGLIIHVEKKS